MKNTVIGIASRQMTVDGVQRDFVDHETVELFLKYDCHPLLLLLGNLHLLELLKLCDGLVLPGGCDLCPSCYGEENKGLSKNTLPCVDELDREIVQYAVENEIPLLGICRGFQAINVFLGGSLYQDIGTSHQSVKCDHRITSVPNEVLPFDSEFCTNSYHHQAVKKIGKGLVPVAYHEEICECVIGENLPIIAVQWHPEKMPDAKESKLFFETFLQQVKRKRSK